MEYIFLLIPMFFSMGGQLPAQSEGPAALSIPNACRFFGKDYALKMAGRSVKAMEESSGKNADGSFSKCKMTTDAAGPTIHFMLEESSDEEIAKKNFEAVRQSNKDHKGFEDWPDVGDEAITHTDGTGFQLVMIRKGPKTIRLKVNPIGKISFDVTKAVAMALETML